MKENKETLRKTIDYMEAHLNENISLNDIAKEVGYSKYHLNRMFAQGMGQTIHKYIIERRLSESAKRLILTDKQIAEIAQDSGYTTQQAYTLAFRQFYHYTPQVYRELNQTLIYRRQIHSYKSKYCKGSRMIYLVGKGVMAA